MIEQRRSNRNSVTRVISFTSGKGGVGKTTTVLNTAIALAQLGKSVLVMDADLGLANVDIMLGLKPQYTLQDVLDGQRSLEQVMLKGPEGISIIPAASGVESICTLSIEQRAALMHAVEEVAEQYDYLLIDTQAGIGPEVLFFNSASSEIICLINGEPTSLTDAYALIKVMSQKYGEKSISIVVNNVRVPSHLKDPNASEREASKAYNRLAKAVERFLHVDLKYLGFIPADDSVREAVGNQTALVQCFPSSRAALGVSALARKIDADFIDLRIKGGIQFFFKQLLEMSAHGS